MQEVAAAWPGTVEMPVMGSGLLLGMYFKAELSEWSHINGLHL